MANGGRIAHQIQHRAAANGDHIGMPVNGQVQHALQQALNRAGPVLDGLAARHGIDGQQFQPVAMEGDI